MKTKTILASMVFFLMVSAANANTAKSEAKQLSSFKKRQIAWAIKILVDTETINLEKNKCEKLNCDILEQLESEGLINSSDLSPQAICVVPE